jgi:hypothetical protein
MPIERSESRRPQIWWFSVAERKVGKGANSVATCGRGGGPAEVEQAGAAVASDAVGNDVETVRRRRSVCIEKLRLAMIRTISYNFNTAAKNFHTISRMI